MYISQLDDRRLSRVNLPTLGEATFAAVGDVPTYLSFNAAGTRAYVANQFSRTIGLVDVATNTQASSIPVVGDAFAAVANPDDTRLFVVTNANRLDQVDRVSGNVLASVPLAGTGQSLAWHPNGYLLYVSTFIGGTALEIDARTMAVVRSFTTGMKAQDLVVSRDGRELWVADEDLQRVDVFDLGVGTRIVSIPVGGHPWGVALSPDQKQVYVGLVHEGQVVVIDRSTRAVVHTITNRGRAAPDRVQPNRSSRGRARRE